MSFFKVSLLGTFNRKTFFVLEKKIYMYCWGGGRLKGEVEVSPLTPNHVAKPLAD